MKVAVIGSRSLACPDLTALLPPDTEEILSGGAAGIDSGARAYALAHGIPLREFLPEYEKYGRSAPIRRNVQILKEADLVLAFWDGKSRGTRFCIEYCQKKQIPLRVFRAAQK